MAITPEDRARQNIDKLLDAGGWMLQDRRAVNITAGRGVAVREFPMKKGHGEADDLQPMERERAKPIESNVPLRQKVVDIRKSYEQTIDTITKDELLSVGADDAAKEKVKSIVTSFEKFIADNKDEITALQVLYSRPYQQRLRFKEIKELADALSRPHDGLRGMTPDVLWHAYETLDRSRVHGSGGSMLTDIVSLVRFALKEEPDLHPFQEDVNARFARWNASLLAMENRKRTEPCPTHCCRLDAALVNGGRNEEARKQRFKETAETSNR